jgi:hypothetical protein
MTGGGAADTTGISAIAAAGGRPASDPEAKPPERHHEQDPSPHAGRVEQARGHARNRQKIIREGPSARKARADAVYGF